jgi:hypothetical protein
VKYIVVVRLTGQRNSSILAQTVSGKLSGAYDAAMSEAVRIADDWELQVIQPEELQLLDLFTSGEKGVIVATTENNYEVLIFTQQGWSTLIMQLVEEGREMWMGKL